jgi:membrane-associated phospholipid phosphatase
VGSIPTRPTLTTSNGIRDDALRRSPRLQQVTAMNARAPVVRVFALMAVAIIVAHLLDPLAFRWIRIEGVYDEDWGRMLRVMGFVPLWMAAGAALMLHDRPARSLLARSRGALVIWGAGFGGLAAELLKLLVRRLRPGEAGEYVFRPFAERPFSTGGLGMPSSHALVAFGAAAVLSRLFPRARIVWWGLAWGCAFTRVAAGAHFLSDTVAAACVGWLVGLWVWSWRAPVGVHAAPPAQPAGAR